MNGSDKVRAALTSTLPPKRTVDRYRWRAAINDMTWTELLGQVSGREMQRFEDDGGRVG